MAAIEERDGVRFYVERTSPLQPIQLMRTPGFGGDVSWRSRDERGGRPARLARRHRRAARRPTTELAASLRRAGAIGRRWPRRERPREWRTYAADRARLGALPRARAARAAIERHRPRGDHLLDSTTAALLAPRPGAIRFDAPAAGNRPGRHGIWQRPVERRRLREAPLLVPWSEGGLAEAPRAARGRGRRAGAGRAPSGPAGGARHRRDHLRRAPREEGPRPRARRVGARRGATARSWSSPASTRRAGGDALAAACGRLRGASLLARRLPRAAAARARVRHGAAARGLRDRAARGAGRRLQARHDRRAGAVRRAAARARSSTRGSSARICRRAAHGARRPRAPATRSAPRAAGAVAAARRSTAWCAEQLLPRLVSRGHDHDLRRVRPHHRRPHGIGARDRRAGSPPAAPACSLRRPRRACEAGRRRLPGARSIFEADVTDRDAARRRRRAARVEAFGGIDTRVRQRRHRRAGLRPARMDAGDRSSASIEVNLIGVWRTIRACLPHVIERRGYILPVASMAAIAPAGRARRLRRRRSPASRTSRHALRVGERSAFGVDVGVAYFSLDRHRDGPRRRPHRARRAACARCSRARWRRHLSGAAPQPRRSCAASSAGSRDRRRARAG